MFAQVQCLLVAAIAAVAISVPAPVTQEEYARYIAQQQTQRLEEKQPERQAANRRPVQLVQVIPASGAGAYQQPSAPRPLVYQQPSAPRSAYQQPAYQPAQAVAQPSAYRPESVYRPEPYQPAQAYAAQPSYQQPEEYSEQQYQLPAKAQPPRPKAAPKPKGQNRPERPEDEENDNNPNAQYQFSFDISDDESTNYHNRKEQRDGEKISGSYSVVDSDGFIRTVTYTADPEEGFKAEVSREPTNIQVKIPTPAPQPASPAPQYRLPKPQPQYIAASEQESEAQPADPVSGYYRPVPQQVKGLAPAAHRFAGPRPQQAGKASALGYATAPTNSPIIYQAYQQ